MVTNRSTLHRKDGTEGGLAELNTMNRKERQASDFE